MTTLSALSRTEVDKLVDGWYSSLATEYQVLQPAQLAALRNAIKLYSGRLLGEHVHEIVAERVREFRESVSSDMRSRVDGLDSMFRDRTEECRSKINADIETLVPRLTPLL